MADVYSVKGDEVKELRAYHDVLCSLQAAKKAKKESLAKGKFVEDREYRILDG